MIVHRGQCDIIIFNIFIQSGLINRFTLFLLPPPPYRPHSPPTLSPFSCAKSAWSHYSCFSRFISIQQSVGLPINFTCFLSLFLSFFLSFSLSCFLPLPPISWFLFCTFSYCYRWWIVATVKYTLWDDWRTYALGDRTLHCYHLLHVLAFQIRTWKEL